MKYVNSIISEQTNFFGNSDPFSLINEYGSPLYIYNEKILRERCREMKNIIPYKNFSVHYSIKANNNLTLLKIIKDEGLNVDAISPGEIYINLLAGFLPSQIFYISNNVDDEEMKFAIEKGVNISVDSISQLEKYGKLNPGGKVAFRLNPGKGAGHHKKVVTGGKKTKFGIELSLLPEVKNIAKKYNLKISGINQHIGSLFMDYQLFVESVETILEIAKDFQDLEFIDLGGGFGIPYHKQEGEKRLDLKLLGKKLNEIIEKWVKEYGKEIEFKIEPGRYIVAESSILIGKVNCIKTNYNIKYVGTDIGFNVLIRPAMYEAHHDVEIYRNTNIESRKKEEVRIVGNICETGDILAKDRLLPEVFEGDIIGLLDAGAYGYSMSSNYNARLRPAEILIDINGNPKLIRKRDSFEDLVRNYII